MFQSLSLTNTTPQFLGTRIAFSTTLNVCCADAILQRNCLHFELSQADDASSAIEPTYFLWLIVKCLFKTNDFFSLNMIM